MKYALLQGLRWYMLSMAVTASAQVSAPVSSSQLPTGGKVMSGTTSIQSVGNVLNINQSSQRSVIDWNTFNVGGGAKVNFIQPSANSVTLNRVLDTNGSQILGSISANGQVFISNPNGVLFGPNSQVNVGGLLATTQNISVDDFMAGKSTFEGTGGARSVVNQGKLEAALGGYIALLAPSVRNEGVVLAREGTVVLAAGDKTVVKFNGPQLVTVMVDRSVLDALVENKQMVRVDGGLVIFSARSANAVLSSVVKNTGTVQANTIVNRQGRILLEGGSQGVVEIGGTLQASGVDAGTLGGTISATGDKVSVVSGALLDATGQAGGGNVLVGGGWQGNDPSISSSNAVHIASGAVLNASAIQNGRGGTVVAWSDTQNSSAVTKVQGNLLARGGADGGDGGRIETSGRWISTSGATGDASAAKGLSGQWLFDPYNVEIVSTATSNNGFASGTWTATGSNSTILNSSITSLLNAGTNVTITTTGAGLDAGNIVVNAPIVMNAPIVATPATGSVNLTLTANKDLTINQPITVNGSGSKIQLTAGNALTNGSILFSGNVKTDTLSMDLTGNGTIAQTAATSIQSNNLRISAPSSIVTLPNTANNFGALAANVGSLYLTSSQGIEAGSIYGPGTYITSLSGIDGITASGTIDFSVMNGNIFIYRNISTTSTLPNALVLNAGESLLPGTNYAGINANNPYGPNIVLTDGRTISVGTLGSGKLYTGGFDNSGYQLASYLGANKSRYNSDKATTDITTNLGTGLTAIYRQNPNLVVTAPNLNSVYGSAISLDSNTVSGFVNNDTQLSAVGSVGTSSFNANFSTTNNQRVGAYSIKPADATNRFGYGFTYTNGTLQVAQKQLTIRPVENSANKVYDSTNTANVTLETLETLSSDKISGDSVIASYTNASFTDKNVGAAKPIEIKGIIISGADAANYALTSTSSNTIGNIMPKTLTISGITAADKIYDGKTTATINTSKALKSGLIANDLVNIASTGVFDTKDAGANKTVTLMSTYTGADLGNYKITNQASTTATINKANATVIGNSDLSEFNGAIKTLTGFTVTGLVNGETIGWSTSNTNGVIASVAGKFPGTYLNKPFGTANNYNLSFVSGQMVITGCASGPPCSAIAPQPSANNATPVVIPAATTSSFSSAEVWPASPTSAAPVMTFALSSRGSLLGSARDSGDGSSTNQTTKAPISVDATPNNRTTTAPATSANIALNSIDNLNVSTSIPNNLSLTNPSPTNVDGPTNINAVSLQSAPGSVIFSSSNATPSNTRSPQPNSITPQRLADILNKKEPVEIATALSPIQVSQLSSDQVAPLINLLNLRQLLSLTNEQIAKFEPARQTELLNIIKILEDNPEKATDKAFTPTDKTFAQLATNGLLKEQMETLSSRVTQISQNKTASNIDTPQKLAELLNKKDSLEIASTLPSNFIAQLTPEQVEPLINSLTLRQLLSITNEQIAKLEPARQVDLLNIVNTIKNNPEIVADKVYNAIDKTIAQYAANGLLKDQIDSLASRVAQLTQSKPNILTNQPVTKLVASPIDQPNTAPPIAPLQNPTPALAGVTLTPKQVSELDPAQLTTLISQLNANQLMAITNPQMSRLNGRALNQLSILMNFVQQRAADTNDVANGKNSINAVTNRNSNVFANQPVSKLASNALLNEQPKPNALVEAPSLRQTNISVNLTPKQVSELEISQLAPLISQLNANQLMAITNTQMARLDNQSINQLNILMNFVQQRALNPAANATIFTNQPVSRVLITSLINDQPIQPQVAGAAPNPIATVPLSPQQIAGLTSSQVASLLNRMNSRQLMAVTDTQMASLDNANLNQLITLLNLIQDSARTSSTVTNNFANRPVAGFLPPELNTSPTGRSHKLGFSLVRD